MHDNTVDREIFIVKNFSLMIFPDEKFLCALVTCSTMIYYVHVRSCMQQKLRLCEL